MNKIDLINLNQIEEIITNSTTKLILIFKHSNRCVISSSVLNKFEKVTHSFPENVTLYFLDLLSYRAISNEIASKFNVYHESPQLLVIKEGKAIASFSHYNIISQFNLEDYM